MRRWAHVTLLGKDTRLEPWTSRGRLALKARYAAARDTLRAPWQPASDLTM